MLFFTCGSSCRKVDPGGVSLKHISKLSTPPLPPARTMGSLWASVSLLCGVFLLWTEGKGQQQTKSNVPRLKLSYKGQFSYKSELLMEPLCFS